MCLNAFYVHFFDTFLGYSKIMKTMKNMVLAVTSVLVFSAFTGCGRRDVGDFGQYVETFEQAYGQPVNNIVIEWGDLSSREATEIPAGEGHVEAVCHHGVMVTTPTITVDENRFSKLSAAGKEMVILHELGHCVLNLGHSAPLTGIMSAPMYNQQLYQLNREAMIKQLFDSGI